MPETPADPHSYDALPAPVTAEEKAQDKLAAREEVIRKDNLDRAINSAREKYDPRTDLEGFVREVSKRFIENKLDSFPEICDIARMQNLLKRQELEKTGNRGRYSGKAGWSRDQKTLFKYEIPRELYLFMINLVYKDFWAHDNVKIADAFMRRIIRGEDPMTVLMYVKKIYGANSQQGIITI